MINIVCIYKTGGDFGEDYVIALYNACRKNITRDFNFVCFTDDSSLIDKYGKWITFLSLHNNWQGWWNKFEIFKLTGANLYLDLDTIIVGNINRFIDFANGLHCDEFIGVKAFNPIRNKVERTMMNSGVMAWKGDFEFIFNRFNYEKDSKNSLYCGDQDRVSEILRNNYIRIRYWQDFIVGLYSYKRHIVTNNNKLPDYSRIICFHGQPRPRDMIELEWVKENWRCEKIES